jgi:short-subunit dehydrogenase
MSKFACITGASEGLGRVFAKQLAAQGFLTINIARNEQRLQELVAELGEGHRYHVADLSDQQGIVSCTELIEENRINLLVNNAGFSQFGLFREADVKQQVDILTVNCTAIVQLSHAFLRQANTGDALINLSSITNYLTTPIQPTYCATKCFIASFSESLWYQERSRGVYVQALLPGITKTQFIERSSDIEGFKKKLLDVISHSPETVVATALKAVSKRRKPVVIPGLSNKLVALLLPLLPKKWTVWVLGKVGELA